MTQLSPQRAGKIGSSMIAGLLGQSPWLTRFQLYAHFTQGYPLEVADNNRLAWGRRLQDDILDAVAEREGWEIEPNAADVWEDHPDTSLRCGATVDGWVRRNEAGPGILECKSVDWKVYRDEWTDGRAPVHYELQLQHQLWVTGAAWGGIAPLVGGNELAPVIRRAPNASLHARFEVEVRSFWSCVAKGIEPEPSRFDLEALVHLYPEAIPEPTLFLWDDEELAQALEELEWSREAAAKAKAVGEAAKAKILARAGGHLNIRTNGWSATVGRIPIKAATIERKAHVRLDIRARRHKGEEEIGWEDEPGIDPVDALRAG